MAAGAWKKAWGLFGMLWREYRQLQPLDRGITSFVLSDTIGLLVEDVAISRQWSWDVDEISNRKTKSYLPWPIWDSRGKHCIEEATVAVLPKPILK